MLYIMRRTQLYLNEDLWQVLHAQAATSRTSISELVRQALRERYLTKPGRKEAMRGVVGIWSDRTDLPDTETYIRALRTDNRLERIYRDSDPD